MKFCHHQWVSWDARIGARPQVFEIEHSRAGEGSSDYGR